MDAIAEYGSTDEDELPDHPSSNPADLSNTATDLPRNDPHSILGRIRSFPHVPGNFPVHVYIEIPVPHPIITHLNILLQKVKLRIPNLYPIESNAYYSIKHIPCNSAIKNLAQESYHVSLSHTAPIRLSESDSLLTSLRSSLHDLEPFGIQIHPTLEVFINDERTRTFLALKAFGQPTFSSPSITTAASRNKDPLLRAIESVSDSFEMHGLPRFYADARPHTSLAWLLGDQVAALETALGIGIGKNENDCPEDLKEMIERISWKVDAEAIWCKIGSKNLVIWRKR